MQKSFSKFLLTEAEKKISAKEFNSICKSIESELTKIDKILDSEAIKMSGNPNVSGAINKLKGALEKALDMACNVVEKIEERKEAEKLEFPHAKKMSDEIGTGIKKGKK